MPQGNAAHLQHLVCDVRSVATAVFRVLAGLERMQQNASEGIDETTTMRELFSRQTADG